MPAVATGMSCGALRVTAALTATPLIVNRTIYIGSSSGLLDGLDLHGQQVCSTQVGAPFWPPGPPDEQNPLLTTGLGAGDGRLVVPAGGVLAVYGNLNSRDVCACPPPKAAASPRRLTSFFS